MKENKETKPNVSKENLTITKGFNKNSIEIFNGRKSISII